MTSMDAFDLDHPLDLSIRVDFPNKLCAFGAPSSHKQALKVDGFVGDLSQGGSCNCDVVSFVPHCHGTHTESAKHLGAGDTMPQVLISFLGLAQVVTITSNALCLDVGHVQELKVGEGVKALIIRTLPNDPEKKQKHYKSQAPYLSPSFMQWIKSQGIEHVLVDFPSVDPMEDGGKLLAHRTFWDLPLEGKVPDQGPFSKRTITELIYVPNEVPDGVYLLSLTPSNLALDATPSRPILFRRKT